VSNRAPTDRTPLILVSGHTFGLRAFEGIFASRAYLERRVDVALMIGLDDSHAGATVGYQSLEPLACEQGVPHISTSDGRLTSLAGQIRDAGPAYILIIGWSRLVPAEILAIPAAVAAGALSPASAAAAGVPSTAGLPSTAGVPSTADAAQSAAGAAYSAAGEFGCIGMHPTRLPEGRGQAPIPWTIIKGCQKTALSVFFLEPGADSGPIIAQYDLDVHPRETASSLFYRVANAHFTAGLELAEDLGKRHVSSRVQDPATATRWPKRRPADGEIRDTMTCREIDSLVRALMGPYPRAFVMAGGRKLDILATQFVPASAENSAGHADLANGRVRYRCADGTIDLFPVSSLSAAPGAQ